jgi:uncharacterized protein YkwD
MYPDWVADAGFTGVVQAGGLAGGIPDAEAVVDSWVSAGGTLCENIMNSAADKIGVGHYSTSGDSAVTNDTWVALLASGGD